LHPGGHRLCARHHSVQGVCGAGVVRGPSSDDRLGALFRALSQDPGPAGRASHLRGQLVLPGLHPSGGDATHRQQPGDPRIPRPCQELFPLRRGSGRHDPVVVRPQRGATSCRSRPGGRSIPTACRS
jgi:hypothetical protein